MVPWSIGGYHHFFRSSSSPSLSLLLPTIRTVSNCFSASPSLIRSKGREKLPFTYTRDEVLARLFISLLFPYALCAVRWWVLRAIALFIHMVFRYCVENKMWLVCRFAFYSSHSCGWCNILLIRKIKYGIESVSCGVARGGNDIQFKFKQHIQWFSFFFLSSPFIHFCSACVLSLCAFRVLCRLRSCCARWCPYCSGICVAAYVFFNISSNGKVQHRKEEKIRTKTKEKHPATASIFNIRRSEWQCVAIRCLCCSFIHEFCTIATHQKSVRVWPRRSRHIHVAHKYMNIQWNLSVGKFAAPITVRHALCLHFAVQTRHFSHK